MTVLTPNDDLSKLIPISPPSADGTVTATETGVEFAGFLRNGREHRFVLTAPSRGSSEWLTLGQSYAGLTLVEFDAAREVLAVRADGRTLRLALKDGRPRAAPQGREAEIVVDPQGQLFVGGEKTPSADLRWRLENLAQNIPNISFNLVVVWPRNADGGLVERLGNQIAETVRTLPPELRKRYLSLAWKTAER